MHGHLIPVEDLLYIVPLFLETVAGWSMQPEQAEQHMSKKWCNRHQK